MLARVPARESPLKSPRCPLVAEAVEKVGADKIFATIVPVG